MPTMRACIAGCPTLGIPVYKFPPETNKASRDLWFRKFGLDSALYANKSVFICRRHFSAMMTIGRSLRNNTSPDVNLRKCDEHMPYTERYSEYFRDGNPPPGEDKVMAISESMNNETTSTKNVAREMPVTEQLSDIDVAEITLCQTDEQSSSKDLDIVESRVETYVPYQKRQCILKCQGRRKFHILPSIETELERRKKWLYLLAKDPDLYQSRYHYVCDLHFDIHMVGMSKLIRGAYPNANLPPPLQKSIQENMEAKTECLQKCTDYKRKFRFPSVQYEIEKRKTWLRKFGRDPEFFNHDLYACDRHFSDKMRIGPYLLREAVPDQNLYKVFPEVENTENGILTKYSIQRLKPLVQGVPIPTAQRVQMNQNLEDMPLEIQNNVNFVNKNWSIKRLQTLTNGAPPKPTAPTTQIPKNNTQPKFIFLGKSAPASATTAAEIPQKDKILNRLNMTMLPPVHQAERPHSPVQYVKMHTLGVFVKRREGYTASVDKILSAEDPLDVEKFKPLDFVKPIEPQLSIDVQIIQSKNYEDFSSDDGLGEYDEENSAYDKGNLQVSTKRGGGEVWQGETKKLKLSKTQMQSRSVTTGSAQFKQFLNARSKQPDDYLSNNAARVEEPFEISDSEAESDDVVKDAALEHRATKHLTETCSIQLDGKSQVVEYRKDAGVTNSVEEIITPDEPSVAEVDYEPLATKSESPLPKKISGAEIGGGRPLATTIVSPLSKKAGGAEIGRRRFRATKIGYTLPKKVNGAEIGGGRPLATKIGSTAAAQSAIPHNSKTDLAARFLLTRRQQRPSDDLLTNEVTLAESWQQVIGTIDKDLLTSGIKLTENSENQAAKSTPKNKDMLAAAAKPTNDERKKVGGPGEKNVNGTKTVTVTFAATARHQQAINAIGCVPANRLLTNPNRLLNTTKNCVLENQPNAGLGDTSTLNASCILGCDTFHKLYTFPSAKTDPQRRHFWFLELRMKLTANWHESLYICENHFEKSMFTENSLHKYAYPCKGLRHILKVPRRKAVNETKRNAIEQHNYEGLLSELTELQELECRQAKEINRIKVLIRLKQEAMRLMAELESSKEASDVK